MKKSINLQQFYFSPNILHSRYLSGLTRPLSEFGTPPKYPHLIMLQFIAKQHSATKKRFQLE